MNYQARKLKNWSSVTQKHDEMLFVFKVINCDAFSEWIYDRRIEGKKGKGGSKKVFLKVFKAIKRAGGGPLKKTLFCGFPNQPCEPEDSRW